MAELEQQTHPIAPVFDACSRVLVLGSFPSPKSREQGFYYGHPQNRFWRVLARVLDEPYAATVERRRDQLLRRGIAMWDVLASCTIEGASDASIRDAVPNDLAPIFEAGDIRAVLCAGATATRLYRRHLEPMTSIPCLQMPSTSPANAAWSLERLVGEWRVLLDYLDEPAAPVLDVPDVAALERRIAAGGTSLTELMDRAGGWLAWRIREHDVSTRVLVLAGNGNNGGDGWVAARELVACGREVVLVCAKPPAELKAEPARTVALAALPQLEDAGARVLVGPEPAGLAAVLECSSIIVDALLGTGFAHERVCEPFASWVEAANRRRAQGAWTISADVPSGLNAQTGAAGSPCIEADETVTMLALKPGLLTGEGPQRCGTVTLAPLCDVAPYSMQAKAARLPQRGNSRNTARSAGSCAR